MDELVELFSFEGRANRSRYWLVQVVGTVLLAFYALIFAGLAEAFGPIFILPMLGVLWAGAWLGLAVTGETFPRPGPPGLALPPARSPDLQPIPVGSSCSAAGEPPARMCTDRIRTCGGRRYRVEAVAGREAANATVAGRDRVRASTVTTLLPAPGSVVTWDPEVVSTADDPPPESGHDRDPRSTARSQRPCTSTPTAFPCFRLS